MLRIASKSLFQLLIKIHNQLTIKIEIWSQIQQYQFIWNFDASGSIIEDVKGQKKPYLYSMVSHDELNNNIIPMFQFVTTDHTFINISSYLSTIRKVFEKYKKSRNLFAFAPVIVTDFSWTLISSVLDAFNNVNVNEYLSLCFEILADRKEMNTLKTVIYLCAAHFIKLVIKKVKKALPLDDKIKREFIFFFSLLQNSTNLAEFENYFIHIITVFHTPTINNFVKSSLSFLRLSIKNRDPSDLSYVTFDSITTKEEEERVKNFELLTTLLSSEKQTKINVKKSSKFQVYYETLFNSCNKVMMKYGSNLNSNPFYSPQLVTIIINYLYVMPMWSGVMLHKRTSHLVNYKSKKRTTNNPVESHFDFDKNKLLHKKRFVKPSEFIAPKYRFLLSKFIQNYLTEINQEKKIKKQITDELEMWKNKKQFNRIKGFYYQNIAYFEKDQEIGSNYQSYQNDTSNKFKHEAPDQLQVVNDVEINPNRILKGNLVSFQN